MALLRVFMFLLALGTSLCAASLEVSLTPSQPVAGETVEYRAILKDASGSVSIQSVPQTSGLSIQWNSPSQSNSTQIVNGHMTRSFTLTWRGRAGSMGSYTLPPLVLKVGQQTLTSRAIDFKIGTQQTSQFYLLRTSIDQTDITLGDMFHYHVDICIAEQELSRYQRSMGGAYELAGRHYDTISLPKAYENDFHITVAQGRQAQNGAYFGSPIGTQNIDGFNYQVHRLSFLLEPKRVGRLALPAWDMAFYKLKFGRDFFGRAQPMRQQRPIMASCESLTIKVSAPPSEGQPQDFSGQVCQDLQIKVIVEDIQPNQVIQLHSPISIRVEVHSSLPSTANREPNWAAQSWHKDFDLNTAAITRKDEDGYSVFSGIIVRPKNKDLKALPPLKVSFYHSTNKTYETRESEAFPFQVEAVDDQAVLESQADEVLSLQPKTKKKMSDHLFGLELDPQRLQSEDKKDLSWTTVMILTGMAWLASLWILSQPWRQQWQAGKASQQKYSRQQQLKKCDAAQNTGELLNALTRFICHHYDCNDPYEAQLEPSQKASLHALLQTLESAQYSPQGGDDQSQKNEVKAWISACPLPKKSS